MGASISYNGYDFATTGRPHFSRQAKYEPDGEGGPMRRAQVTYAIQQIFNEDSFGDNQARYAAMRDAIQSVPEAQLIIKDEFGNTLVDVIARPTDNNLPEQWGQWMTETTVSFQATELINNGANAVVTDPANHAVTLKNVTGWREAIRTERPTYAINNRRETNGTVVMSGRIIADPTQSEATRRTQLQNERDLIRGVGDHKQVTLQFGTFNQAIRIDDVSADIKDGSYELEWQLSASYRRFPDGEFTEAEYEVSAREDLERGEIITTVRGRVRANTVDEARAKVSAINTLYLTVGRQLRRTESNEQIMDGEDGTDNYNEVTFSTEYREALDIVSWTLTVTDKQDAKSGEIITTYSGKVTALLAVTALNKARVLGASNYPILMTSTESVTTSQIDDQDQQFVEVTFSYEYVRQGTLVYAEITSATDRATFGQSSTNVSGFAVAATQNDALALARSFKPVGLEISNKEDIRQVKGVNGALTATIFTRVDFNYVYFLAPAAGSIEYAKESSNDYDSREISTTFSGTAYGASRAACDALINPLIVAGGHVRRDQRTENRMKSGANDVLRSVTFSVSFVSPLPQGTDDILEAEMTMSQTGSVDHAVITPIPFGSPFVQSGCGLTPGLKSVSGSITAINAGTAQTWGRSKRDLATLGGFEDPPEERLTSNYFPFSGSSVKAFRFQFTYSARYPTLVF